MISALNEKLRDVLATGSAELPIAGAVVGVDLGGERILLAEGTANLNTGQPFTPDAGFLLGSVTKVLVTTALLRLIERGRVDLDEQAIKYVPEFALADAGAAEQITVRMLLNHTNGINADALGPSAVRGRDASRSYTEALAGSRLLFEPGTFIHYSNPGFVLAARILEEETGLPFERAIEQEVLAPCGMSDSTAIQTQAFLRRTAIGAFADPKTNELRATSMFTLAESMAGAGTTLIVTPRDMLTFGRMHLKGGMTGSGTRLVSHEGVTAMRTQTFDTGLPQAPPVGLGWWMPPIAGTTALWHGGGSPGGSSSFSILPEHDCVIVSFATGGRRGEMNDLLHNAVIEELTSEPIAPPFEFAPGPPGPEVAGEYASFQSRRVVQTDGDSLLITTSFEPCDEDHAQTMSAYDGGTIDEPEPVKYESVSPGLYAPSGESIRSLSGIFGRIGLLSTLPPAPGRRGGLHSLLRFTPKVSRLAE